MRLLFLLGMAATLVFTPVTGAQTVLHVPGQFKTIQAAIDRAGARDTVLVAPGIYREIIDFKGKTVLLRSQGGAGVTTLDGGGKGSVVTFKNGESRDALIQGFTITGGSGTRVSATSTGGAGIYISGGSAPSIWNNRIEKNATTGSYGAGGGIFCDRLTAPDILDNIIRDNRAAMTGGGIHSALGVPMIRGNLIEGNHCDYGGGGIFGLSAGLVIEGNTLRANVCTGQTGLGGGIYFQQGTIRIEGNVLEGNRAIFGGGICLNEGVTSWIEGNRLTRNEAESGGGIHYQGGQHDLVGNVLCENRAIQNGHGGGISITGGTFSIRNNILHGNTAVTRGGGVYSRNASPAVINNTIYGNQSTLGGGMFISDLHHTHTPFTNNIIWNNSALQGRHQIEWTHTQPVASHCNIQGGWPGTANLNVVPLFVDPAGGDFHLYPFSPCVDRGDGKSSHLPAADFEGDPRSFLGGVDIGADEVHPRFYQTGDASPGGKIKLKVFGFPGAAVTLGIGTAHLEKPIPLPGLGALHLFPPIALLPLGKVPATGVLVYPVSLPKNLPVPVSIPMQVLNGSGLSNLVKMDVW